MTFAERLKQLRESKGLKQIELAKKLNLTSAALSQYEKGIREPNSEMLKKIADYFNVSTDFLLGRIDKININKEKPKLDPSIKTIAAHRIGSIED
ncbi:helix-turn-helix transcriptional regulator, partial [Paraclostridium benzoelyticum]|nr:helix-turn-helix transcriptional regulator [Paraclostridium benzoelyticum]